MLTSKGLCTQIGGLEFLSRLAIVFVDLSNFIDWFEERMVGILYSVPDNTSSTNAEQR